MYGKVIDRGETKWFKEIKSNMVNNAGMSVELKHLGVYFDDDSLYEFICGSFHASIGTSSDDSASEP